MVREGSDEWLCMDDCKKVVRDDRVWSHDLPSINQFGSHSQDSTTTA